MAKLSDNKVIRFLACAAAIVVFGLVMIPAEVISRIVDLFEPEEEDELEHYKSGF